MSVTTPAAPSSAHVTALPQDFTALIREDPEIADVLLGELHRQSSTLQLIAAENFTSPAVLAALGSPLANKYAEDTPAPATTAAARWPTPPN